MEITNEQINEVLSNEETRGTFLETIAETEQGKAYLKNHADTHFDNNVGTKIGEIYGNIDKDLKELGFEKQEGVRTFDFVKSTISTLKEKANSFDSSMLTSLKSENEELKQKLDSNEGTKYFKDLLESTKTTAKAEIEKYKGELDQFKTNELNNKINTELKNTISSFSFDDSIKKPVLDSYVNSELKKLSTKAEVAEDGSITFYDDNGEIIVNKKTMFKADAQYILSEKLKEVLVENRNAEGGGGNSGKDGKRFFGNAKNQMELISLIDENLLADGYVKGTDIYQEKLSELLKANKGDLPLR
jgi:hypothetical protein|tara:strand:- start:1081 stop:1986 length:906 start_codon:yes stop_codon:yes gene_type:complete